MSATQQKSFTVSDDAAMPEMVIIGNKGEVYTKILNAEDSQEYKTLRLEALQKDAKVFSASYQQEREWPKRKWDDICTEDDDHCVIGVFNNEKLIGITSAMTWDDDLTGKSVMFRSSYIMPEFRRKGLSELLCLSRIRWARDKNKYDIGILFHREGHWVSRIVENIGAKYWRTISMSWANGDTANGIWYKYKL